MLFTLNIVNDIRLLHHRGKFLILSALPEYDMEKKLLTIKNFFKNSGVSFPPILITLTWLFSTYLLYPHQPAKVPLHIKATNKISKIKNSDTKIASRKVKTNTYTFSYDIQTPTPTITQVSPSPQPTLVTNPTATPTLAPAPTSEVQITSESKQPVPTQEKDTPTTAPVENQTDQAANNQAQNNNALSGVSKLVNQIVPSAVSILNSNPLISK